MCIKNDLLSKCWRAWSLRCARIVEIYERNAHWQTTTHTQWIESIAAHSACTMRVHQCCVRDVFLHILCARCCPSNIYPSVRPFVRSAHSNAFSVASMIQCLWILFENGYDKWLFISFNHGIVVSPCPPLPIGRTNVTRGDAPLFGITTECSLHIRHYFISINFSWVDISESNTYKP